MSRTLHLLHARARADLLTMVSAVTRMSLWQLRALGVALLVLGPPLLFAPMAHAADEAPANPWLSFFTPKDSHGMSPWQYDLSLDAGGITQPWKGAAVMLATVGWMVYRFWVVSVCWLLDFVLQFKQLELLRGPARTGASVIEDVVARVGIVPAITTLSVLLSGFLLLRSRTGAAVGEMVTTAVIAALLGTGLAHPVGWVASDDGLLARARDAGTALTTDLVIATGMSASNDIVTAADARTVVQQRMLDALVRKPHQLINYGADLDRVGGGCATAYNQTLRTPVAGQDARVPIGNACGARAKAASADPLMALLGVLVVAPSGSFFFLLVFTLAIVLFALTALALFEAAKFVVALVRSILPGSNRAAVFTALATILVAAGLVAVALASIAVLILVLDAVFAATGDWPAPVVFIVVDVLLLVMAVALIVMMMRAKKHGRRLGEGAVKAVASRPAAMPKAGGVMGAARDVALPVMQLRQYQRMRHSLGGGTGHARGSSVGSAVAGGMRGAARVAGKGAVTAAKVGLASTVGAPVYAPRAAAAAKTALTARKAAMVSRLHTTGAAAGKFGREYAANVADGGRIGLQLGVGAAHVASGNPAAAAPHVAAALNGAGALVDRAEHTRRHRPPVVPLSARQPSTGPGRPAAGLFQGTPTSAAAPARPPAPSTGPIPTPADRLRARMADHKPKANPPARPARRR